jgi:hypothetical protein
MVSGAGARLRRLLSFWVGGSPALRTGCLRGRSGGWRFVAGGLARGGGRERVQELLRRWMSNTGGVDEGKVGLVPSSSFSWVSTLADATSAN